VHQSQLHSIDELKNRLLDVWYVTDQSVVDDAVNEWRKRLRACVRAKGEHRTAVVNLIIALSAEPCDKIGYVHFSKHDACNLSQM